MNKIFKIVFNAARGKMMVVNEATSSVQTGKKAAVTVAVMATLVGGTAQAGMTINGEDYLGGRYIGEGQLVITDQTISGGPFALYAGKDGASVDSATTAVTNSTFESSSDQNWAIYGGSRSGSANITDGTTEVNISNSKGFLDVYGSGCKHTAGTFTSSLSKVTADNVQLSGSGSLDVVYRGRIFGAGYLSSSGATMTFEKTEVNVNNVYGSVSIGGGIDNPGSEVAGGGKLYVLSANDSKLIVKDATVVVNGEQTSLYAVYGGSHISGSSNTGILETHKTKITINNGYIKQVIGGNKLNYYGGNASLGSSEIVINGGTVDMVVGGNMIEIGGGSGEGISATRTASADSTSVKVLGGKVGTVVGGGYSSNGNSNQDLTVYDVDLNSSAKSTSVSISNAEVTGDVIGGGLSVGSGTSASASDKVDVVVENSTVAGVITTDDMNDSGVQASQANGNVAMSLTNVKAAKVQASKGSVEIKAEGKDSKSSIGELAVADQVKVALTADGEANDAASGDVFAAVGVSAEDVENVETVKVAMAEGMTQGAVSGTIEGGVAKVTQATNSIMSNTLDLGSSAPLAMNRLLMNDVRKRMGDLRAAEGTHGVWARYDGGKLSGSNSLENDFTTIQVGIDTVPVVDAPRFGVAFSYTTSDTDMKRGGAEMDAFGLAFYGTKMYDNGMFVDVIGRMATADTDVTVDGDKKGTMDNIALSLSGEFGWRFDVTDQFFVEPQAELTYTYVNADTLTLSNTSYEFDSVDSLMGRVGFVAGFKCPADFGNVYVRASAVHEFLGDAAVRGGTSIHEIDGEDTWVEYGIGANFNINKNTYVYADIERTEGAKLEEDWRANVGVRFAF